jgi:hypothetical protein
MATAVPDLEEIGIELRRGGEKRKGEGDEVF